VGEDLAVAKTSGASRHLHAVDVIRVLTVAGVIAAHSTTLTMPTVTAATGGVLVVVHVTRDVFLLLSAFVLGWTFVARPLPRRAFWRRRYPLVAIPYVVWSLIYIVADGDLGSPLHFAGTLGLDLLDGGAHFHLYFLLLTFQLYLVFPALFGALARRPRLHAPLLAASVAVQLFFTAAVHYGWRPPVLAEWLNHPGSWLPSYQLYVIAGLLAALHFDAITTWVRRRSRSIALAFVASVGLALGSYVFDLTVLGYAPVRASEVFQPATVVEALAATLAQLALGLWVADRLGERHKPRLRTLSDASFGIYLAHPLLVAGLLDVAGWAGVSAAVGTLPSGLIEALVVLGLVPFVYAATLAGVLVVRRTKLSLALTGRRSQPSSASRASVSRSSGERTPPMPAPARFAPPPIAGSGGPSLVTHASSAHAAGGLKDNDHA
jgi:peptidoglycan/LPS O-acetylase OafA/YrhL